MMFTLLVAASLVGCTGKGSLVPSGGGGSGGGGSGGGGGGGQPTTKEWNSSAKAVMQTEVGEVLPYATGILDNYTVQEREGEYPPMIYDDSEVFTIENYYQSLATAGWTVGEEDGEIFFEDEYGDLVCYNYKKSASDSLLVYCTSYYFDNYYGGNTIEFDSWSLVNTKTEDTSWGDLFTDSNFEDLVPFVQLGSDYEGVISEDGMQFQIADSYYQNLLSSYDQLLEADGYSYNQELGCYEQNYDTDGNKIQLYVSYSEFLGNTITGTISLKVNETTSWPTTLTDAFLLDSGLSFTPVTGEGFTYAYSVFKGQVSVQIFGDFTEEDAWDAIDSIYASGDQGITGNYNPTLYYFGMLIWTSYNWAETKAIVVDYEEPLDWEDLFAQRAEEEDETTFTVTFANVEESFSEFGEFPAQLIEDTYGVEVPSLTGDFKWQVQYAEEEEEEDYEDYSLLREGEEDPATAQEVEAIYVYSKDLDTKVGTDSNEDLFVNALKNIPMYVDDSGYADAGYAAEDAEGKVALQFFTDRNTFQLSVSKGSGEAHTRGISLNKEAVNIKQGGEFQIEVSTTMIYNYDVSYSSDNVKVAVDSEGKVTVGSEVEEGTTANITVTVTDNRDSQVFEKVLAVTVKNVVPGWYKINTDEELTVGNSYTFVHEEEGKNKAAGALTSGYLSPVDVTISEYYFETVDGIMSLELGGSASTGYTFLSDDGYLNLKSTSNNKLEFVSTASSSSYWDLTFTDGNVKVANHASSEWSIQYNTGNPRFSDYKTKQAAIQLYEYRD